MKHAFLIIAHNNWNQVGEIIKLLDSPLCDFFIHVNSLASEPEHNILRPEEKISRIYYSERKKIIWGDYGILDASLALLKAAKKVDDYDYYHLISGSDLPLCTTEYIDDFFLRNLNQNEDGIHRTNYILVAILNDTKIKARVNQYTLAVKYWGNSNKIIRKFATLTNRLFYFIQTAVGVKRLRDKTIYHGSTWWSISDELAEFLLENETWFKKQFGKFTFGADEFAVQTLVMNSKFQKTIFKPQNKAISSNLREIDWKRGNGFGSPHIWTVADFSLLKQSKNIFARKFDCAIDKTIVELVIEYAGQKSFKSEK